MDKLKPYSEFAQENFLPDEVSLEDLEEKMEQSAREEEADNIVLAEDKRVKD